MKKIFSVFLWFSISCSYADEMCKLENNKHLKSSHVVCLYYTGTKDFRENQIDKALKSWEAVLNMKNVAPEHDGLVSGSYNNLGFIYYADSSNKCN